MARPIDNPNAKGECIMSTLSFNPVSPMFNACTQTMARMVWPQGYDPAPNAPESFKALKAEYAERKRITVFNGAASRTIFDDAGTNVDFRAWHDWCHLMGNHNFSLEGETAACEMQCAQIAKRYGDGDTGQGLMMLCRAEVIGQARYYDKFKAFVDDQRGFTMAYMSHPERALCRTW